MLKCCLNWRKIQDMCDKAVDVFPPTVEFVLDWFVTRKMIKNLNDDLLSNDDIIFGNEDSNSVTLLSDEMGCLSVDLNNINLDDVNFDEEDPETIIHDRLLAWCNRFKHEKHFKKM